MSIDISPSNVAFTCTDAFNSDEDLWHMMGGGPVVVEYDGKEPRSPHFPQQLVRSTDWQSWFDSHYDDFCLIDFGESFPVDETRPELNQPFDLRCPETFFRDSMDYRHDLWRTGCVVRESLSLGAISSNS
jgi:serine/threonine-protein kinase SRPK3